MVCDYPQIITEVTPPRGQKAGEGVWDNSQVGFHSSRPGIGYNKKVKDTIKNRYRIIKTIKKVKDTKNRYRMKGIGYNKKQE